MVKSVLGHKTGSSHSGAEEFLRQKHKQPKVKQVDFEVIKNKKYTPAAVRSNIFSKVIFSSSV